MAGLIDDILEAYPDQEDRERQEDEGTRPRELEPTRKPYSKKDFDRATRVKALQYRLAGMTYEQVADNLKCSTNQARAMVQYSLRTAENESVEEMRDIENHRLDAMMHAIWPRVLNGELDALDRALKIAQVRARLNGLEAPKKIDLALSVRQEVEESLRNLEALVEAEVIEDVEEVSEDAGEDDSE